MASQTGSIKFFNEGKGFGFIIRDDGKGDVFVHATTLKKAGIETLNEGDRVVFDIETSNKGERATSIARA